MLTSVNLVYCKQSQLINKISLYCYFIPVFYYTDNVPQFDLIVYKFISFLNHIFWETIVYISNDERDKYWNTFVFQFIR